MDQTPNAVFTHLISLTMLKIQQITNIPDFSKMTKPRRTIRKPNRFKESYLDSPAEESSPHESTPEPLDKPQASNTDENMSAILQSLQTMQEKIQKLED